MEAEKSILENVDTAGHPPRANDETLRLLVESIRDYAIFMLDPNGIVRTWNAGANAQGIPVVARSSVKHFSKFYPEEAIDENGRTMNSVLRPPEGRFEDEGWRVRKDGSQFWANVDYHRG